MRHRVTRSATLVFLALVCAIMSPRAIFASAQAAGQAEVLTNETLVQMVFGKVPKALILSKIQSTPNTFDVTVRGLVALHQGKVPSDVIKAAMMRAPKDQKPKGKEEVLTNDGIVELVNGKVPKDVIIAKIQATKTAFDLTSGGLVSLSQNKVAQDVVQAMMTAPKR